MGCCDNKPLPLCLPLIVVGVIVAFTVVDIADTFFQRKQAGFAELQTIAELKAREVTNWLKERQDDAEFAESSGFLDEPFQQGQTNKDWQALKTRLEQFREHRHFSAVSLLDANGAKLWGSEKSPQAIAPILRAAALAAATERKPRRIGPYRGIAGVSRLDFIVPLSAPSAPTLLAVLHIDLADGLFPALQNWPVPTLSGEIQLFRRDGDKVFFLNDLHHQHISPLILRLPLTTPELPAALALRGETSAEGRVEGVDERGIASVGVVRRIAGTDWLLLARLDRNELYRDSLSDTAWISVVGLLLVLMTRLSLRFLSQRQRLSVALAEQHRQAERLNVLNMLAAIAESSDDAIFAKDLQGRYTLFNRAAAEFVGKSPAEVLGHDDYAIFPAEQAEFLRMTEQTIITEGVTQTAEHTLDTAKGQRVFLATKGPLRDEQGNIVGIFGISRDISEHKATEETFRARERYQRALLDNFPFMVWLKDTESRLLAANKVYAQVANVATTDELVGKTDLDFWPTELAEHYRADDRAVLASGQPQVVEEEITQGGRRFWVETYKSPVELDGRIIGTVGFSRDISERKQAELALQANEERLRVLFKSSNDAIMTIEPPDWRFTSGNLATLALFKVDDEQTFTQFTPVDLSPPLQPSGEASQTAAMRFIEEALAKKRLYFEWVHQRMNGEIFPTSVLLSCMNINGQTVIQATVRDISARKAAEAELLHHTLELERFNRAMVGREIDMIALKQEVNALVPHHF
jgi:PAS domain S-box-containing protein